MHLDEMIEQELRKIRRAPQPQPLPQRDIPVGEAIRRMTDAVMPSVKSDARALRASQIEDEKRRRSVERATSELLERSQPPAASDEMATYQMHNPDFL